MYTPFANNAAVFLIDVIFGFALLFLALRILLQLVRANFFNPICQMVVKITNPVITPLKRVIPNYKRFEIATFLVMWLLAVISLLLKLAVVGGGMSPLGMAIFSLGELAQLVLWIYTGAILIGVVLSWIAPQQDNALRPVLYQLTDPLVGPIRRTLPPLGGLDFSPMIALILLQLVRILVIDPWLYYAAQV